MSLLLGAVAKSLHSESLPSTAVLEALEPAIRSMKNELTADGIPENRAESLIRAGLSSDDLGIFKLSSEAFVVAADKIIEDRNQHSANLAVRKDSPRFREEDLFEGNIGRNRPFVTE